MAKFRAATLGKEVAEAFVALESVPSRILSCRTIGLALAALVLTAGLAHLVPWEDPLTSGLKVISAGLAIAFAPGTLIALAVRPVRSIGLLELLGLGITIGLALTEVSTAAAMLAHIPVAATVVGLAGGSILLAAYVAARPQGMEIVTDRREAVIAVILAIIAFALYVQGASYSWMAGEDGIHIAIVRRLTLLSAPAIDNIYWVPNFIYTYPFPGIHFFFAQIAVASNLDPMFVYLKLRFLWSVMSIVMFFSIAVKIYNNNFHAFVVTLVALVFVINGTFAKIDLYSWAQLIPLSHASDIAMNVLLPALMLAALDLLSARTVRAALLALAISLGMSLFLAVVHVRELVQFLVYMAAFSAAAFIVRRDSRMALRAILLAAAVAAIALTYNHWYIGAVDHVSRFVAERMDTLDNAAKTMSAAEWILRPFQLKYFTNTLETLHLGWTPFALVAAGAWVMAFRGRTFPVVIGGAVFAYLLIIRLPLLTIPYIRMTYFEIMYSPSRNIVLFVYLITGGLFMLAAAKLAAVPPRRLRRLLTWGGALLVSLLFGIFRWGPGDGWMDVIILPAIIGLGWSALRIRKSSPPLSPPLPPARVWGPSFVAILTVTGVLCSSPQNSPLNPAILVGPQRPSDIFSLPTVIDHNTAFPYSTENAEHYGVDPTNIIPLLISEPPPADLAKWAARNLRLDSVFAISLLNKYSPVPFLPQQTRSWPHIDSSTGQYFYRTFREYYAKLDDSLARYRTQPFFNSEESPTERRAFIRDLGISHILVDPMYHDLLLPILTAPPLGFQALWDDGRWAIVAVNSGEGAIDADTTGQ